MAQVLFKIQWFLKKSWNMWSYAHLSVSFSFPHQKNLRVQFGYFEVIGIKEGLQIIRNSDYQYA